jgi:histidinol-phosphate aminotransferase
MNKKSVKVAPHILDLEEYDYDMQQTTANCPDDRTFLKLDRNEATIIPSPEVAKAIIKALDSFSLNHYPDSKSKELRARLAEYAGIDTNSIACFANMSAMIDTITRTYLHPGLEALSIGPAEPFFAQSVAGTGAEAVFTNHVNPFEPNVEEAILSITPKTRLIYIANPNSLTGAMLTETEIVFLLAYAESAMFVIDESYFEFCSRTIIDQIREYPNLTVLRSFARAFALAGFDTSCLITQPANLRFLNRLGNHKEPDTLAQVAAIAALEDINYTANFIRLVNESKKMLLDNLPRLGYEFQISPANYFIIKVNDPDSMQETLAQNSIFVNNMFCLSGFQNYLRITIGTPTQTGILLDILARMIGTQASMAKDTVSSRIRDDMRNDVENLKADPTADRLVNSKN